MIMASCKKKLPQEGTDCSAVGESLTVVSATVCPSYSGGGNIRQSQNSVGSDKDPVWQPVVVLTHCTEGETKNSESAVGAPTLPGDEACDSDGSVGSHMSHASTTSLAAPRARKRMLPPRPEELPRAKKADKRRVVASSEGSDPELDGRSTITRAKKKLPSPEELAKTMQGHPTSELDACIVDSLQEVEKVADKSRNLKGEFVHKLRMAVRTLKAAALIKEQRVSPEANVERLEKENAVLRSQIAGLSAQIGKLSAEVSSLRRQGDAQAGPSRAAATPPSRPADAAGLSADAEASLRRSIALEIGAMMDAKLASLEGRLLPEQRLRPPLAADAKRLSSAPAAQAPQVAQAPPAAIVQASPESQAGTKGKKKRRRRNAAKVAPVAELPAVPGVGSAPAAPEQSAPQAVASTSQVTTPATGAETTGELWSTVAKKAKAKKTPASAAPTTGQSAPPNPKGGKKGKQVSLPKVPASAAITLTAQKGSPDTLLGEVMAEAKRRIKLADLGIGPGAVTMKRSASGGLVIAVTGADCAAKADSLASRMREILLPTFAVQIARPSKVAELRIRDLDDAVTSQEVAEAIAAAGGCAPAGITVGEIHRSRVALGTVWVKCPLEAAKKLASTKRVCVGWTSARVQVLAARPMLCYQCFELGHVRLRCPGKADRSTRCFRCGDTGHMAKACTAQSPKCPLCSDLGLPADHRLGRKACAAQKSKRGKRASLAAADRQRADAPAPPGAGPPEAMDTASPSQP